MLYVQSNCRKHSCNLCCNFCRLEFRGILMWMEQHFQIMKSCSPGTRLNTFSHRSRNVARTEWVTWFWLQSILCVALCKFANIGPTCIVHIVSPSEGSLMNVYWLHSWSSLYLSTLLLMLGLLTWRHCKAEAKCFQYWWKTEHSTHARRPSHLQK